MLSNHDRKLSERLMLETIATDFYLGDYDLSLVISGVQEYAIDDGIGEVSGTMIARILRYWVSIFKERLPEDGDERNLQALKDYIKAVRI